MMRNSALVMGLAVASLALAGQAAADEGIYRCAPNAPGSALLTCLPAEASAAPAQPAAPAAAPPRTLATRTHDFMIPTGELTPAGDVQYSVHELIYNTVSFGLGDRFELSVSAPTIPVVAGVGARLALTPRGSRLRLVIGGDVYIPLFDDADGVLVQATATAAYRGERFNLHGTVSLLKPPGEEEAIGIVTAGVSYQFHRKAAVLLDLARLTLYEPQYDTCYYDGSGYSDCGGGSSSESIVAPLIGIKLMGEHFDTDLGLVFPGLEDGGDELIALPLVSMTYRY